MGIIREACLCEHDLEIRGAGAVLSESQSGEMQEIGFSLYRAPCWILPSNP